MSLVELVRALANSEAIECIQDTPVWRLRRKLLPFMHLKQQLKIDRAAPRLITSNRGHPGRPPDLGHRGRRRIHTEEIVVKPMSEVGQIDMFAGETILGEAPSS